MKLARRRLLTVAAVLLESLLAGGAGRVAARLYAPSRSDACRRLVESLFLDPDAAARLGRRYLVLHPHERDVASMLDGLLEPGERPSRAGLRRRLRARQRHDFAGGVTVIVDGWILSRTEARLCAAVALLRS